MPENSVVAAVSAAFPKLRRQHACLYSIRIIRGYVCVSTVTSVLTELAMKHCSCAM
jgi:hypothetical protein